MRTSEILFAPVPRRFALEDLADILYALPERTRRVSQAIVLRAHGYEAEPLMRMGSRPSKRLLDRFRRLPIFVLFWNEQTSSVMLHPLSDRFDELSDDSLIADLRNAEMTAMARSPGAMLPGNSSFHYEAPNGRHYRSFLRAGTATQSQEALDSIAFWLLPYLSDRTTIVTDSQTILSVALNVSKYVNDLHLQHERVVHSIESLRGYEQPALDELAHRLEISNPRIERRRHLLAICSVVSSGELVDKMLDVGRQLQFDQVDGVALFAGTKDASPAVQAFARLDEVEQTLPVGDCPLCADSPKSAPSIPLRIHPETFHVEVAQALTKSKVTISDARQAERFVAKYRGLDVVRVHRTEVGGHGRHHALYLDGGRMLGHDGFREELRASARALVGRVDVVIAPDHEGAKELVHEVAEVLNITPIICDEDRVGSLNEQDRAAVLGARQLLIVDDVVITGDRIRGYRQFLFELGRLAGTVHVLVAVARPSSRDALQGIRNLVDQMDESESTFHALEEMILPDWGADECPWCVEHSRLEEWLRNYAGEPPGDVLERLELLSNVSDGIAFGAFWSWDGTDLVLGEGSIFAPDGCSDAELAVAVGSALQRMRDTGRLDEEFVPPVAKVLMPEFWARGRFYAPAITAAILRMTKRHDLLPVMPTNSLRKVVDARLAESASHCVRAELFLAMLDRKLPVTELALSLAAAEADAHGLGRMLTETLGEVS